MDYIESFNISFTSLRSNKVRSFLTMLGVIIGVMSIILLISIVAGTRAKIENEVKAIGSNVFMLMPGNREQTHGPSGYSVNKIKVRTVDMLQARSSYGVQASPVFISMRLPVKYKNYTRQVAMVAGTDEKYVDIRNWKVELGSNFRREDIEGARKVAIIGQTVVNDLFRGHDPLGKDITVAGSKFRVIGVTEKKGRSFSQDSDDLVAMPIATIHELTGVDRVDQVVLKVPDINNLDKAVAETKRLLLREMDRDDFTVSTMGELLNTFTTFTNVLSVVMGCIAGISLFIGGIGIMNIMLVTVKERTREIGIRKALGATFSDILTQFMTEAVVIAVLGGLAGILIASAIIAGVGPFIPFPLKVSAPAVIIAFIFSSATGIFFGTFPAVKAARVDPIIALRYE